LTGLALKLTLAPALVAGASLAGRRFGPRVAGWLIGFPVVAGPVFYFYAREQGVPFAARAAAGTLLGIVSLCVFLQVYALAARRWGWLPSVLVGWLGFAAATAALTSLREAPWPAGLAAAAGALAVTIHIQRRPEPQPPRVPPRHDLLVRMMATGALVVGLTGLAHLMGPGLSGLVTPFPVATTILVVFAHRLGGKQAVAAVYAGFLPSLYSFACFCASLAILLGRTTLIAGFVAALGLTLACQLVVLALIERRHANAARQVAGE
jgi:hypothetical protein